MDEHLITHESHLRIQHGYSVWSVATKPLQEATIPTNRPLHLKLDDPQLVGYVRKYLLDKGVLDAGYDSSSKELFLFLNNNWESPHMDEVRCKSDHLYDEALRQMRHLKTSNLVLIRNRMLDMGYDKQHVQNVIKQLKAEYSIRHWLLRSSRQFLILATLALVSVFLGLNPNTARSILMVLLVVLLLVAFVQLLRTLRARSSLKPRSPRKLLLNQLRIF